MTISRSNWAVALAVGAVLAPAALAGQEPAARPAEERPADARTHTVRPGDTLWDLAQSYLGDPFLWPEIYRVNTTVVEDPHWIYPGEVLTIPGAGAPAQPPVADADGGPAAQGAEDLPPASDQPSSRYPRTVFSETERRSSGLSLRQGVVGRNARPEIRAGEYVTVPFADVRGGPREHGKVLARASIPGTAMTVGRERLQIGDQVYVQVPGGGLPAVQRRYVSYRLSDELQTGGQVVVPTGVVEIESAAAGEAAIARVVQEFDDMRIDQGLYPLDSVSIPLDQRPAAVDRGSETTVLWVENDPRLATVQHHLLLRTPAGPPPRPGDQFALVRARTPHEQTGVVLPEREIAVVQVLKVTSYGTSAIIISQQEPPIRVGTRARLIARMP